MRRKMAIFLALALFLTLAVPAGASAQTATNGVPWYKEADDILAYGSTFLGTPYQFGARYGRTDVFDCSSFVKYVYRNYVTLPRSSRQQSQVGQWVPKSQLRKGDLIFFRSHGSSSNRITHVAIYAGNDTLLHTYGAGGVKYSRFGGYWEGRYVMAKRVLK